MREFFRGWKRKVGVVTLLMACLSAVGWERIRHNNDAFATGNAKLNADKMEVSVNWLQFPYWSIVVPLTLLSTWLLLSKPRVAKTTPVADLEA